MSTSQATPLYIGIKGCALALDRETGNIVWRTALKGGDFVNLVLEESDLFAATKGEIFCLDPVSGRIRWNNPLTGMGWGLVTFASGGEQSIAAIQEYRRRQQQAAAASAAGAGSAS